MRKAVKTQILEILETLKEAHKEIFLQIRKKQYGVVRNTLADCQECAAEIGNAIEQYEDDQEAIIKQLEEYCEKLYVINSEMENAHSGDGQRWNRELDSLVESIHKNVKQSIKVTLKVVFFPYKASMWTSLESIWKAADEDEYCEAKVVVIPYYNLNSSGNKEQLMYEADQFPEYVPIVHYSQYDVEQEHPDMVFIHNPYDDANNVTRVPEQYYSYNLKKHTDQLIFSPYGLMGYYNPKAGAFMCCTNASLIADKIVVQSEKVKRIYMDHGVRNERLIALGSPKVDAVVEGLKKPVIYPEGWEERLKGRKVFLLNTHLSYFIKGYIRSLKFGTDRSKVVYERIWEQILNNEDCALIWRPHPLLKPMLRSRNRYETIEYVELLEARIRESNNAVIDSNGDYTVSFRLSDALFSTYSSLIPEYMVSGKPILIYETRLNEDNLRNSPVDYSNIYFSSSKNAETRTMIHDFIQMVLNGEDPLYEERMTDVHRAFSNLDGTIGNNVYSALKKEYLGMR